MIIWWWFEGYFLIFSSLVFYFLVYLSNFFFLFLIICWLFQNNGRLLIIIDYDYLLYIWKKISIIVDYRQNTSISSCSLQVKRVGIRKGWPASPDSLGAEVVDCGSLDLCSVLWNTRMSVAEHLQNPNNLLHN